jgi:hypothetical protein
MATTPPGWYDDERGALRWWDGTQWTEHFAPTQPEPATPVPTAAETPAFAAPTIPAADAGTAVPPYVTAPAQGGYPAPTQGGNPAPTQGVFAGPAYGVVPGYDPAAPAAKKKPHVLSWIGLGVAALGFVLACIPGVLGGLGGWILLPIGLILSIVALFFAGAKWPAITGIIVAVVGGIVGAIIAVVLFLTTAQDVFEELEGGTSQGDPDYGYEAGEGPVAGILGEPVMIEQYSGTAEVTIESATWGTDNGSGYSDAANGGYLYIDVLWTGVSGDSSANPLYFSVVDANGVEGEFDLFGPELMEAVTVGPGEEIRGMVSFDVSDAGPYTVIIRDELMQPAAEVTVEASTR